MSKPPAERREELLDAALRLCAELGYDQVSVDQITRDAGVSKGVFYYYFGSKQDMLIALVNRFADELFADLDARASALAGTGLQRFRGLLLEATGWKTARLDDALAFVPLLYKPENLELRHRLFDAWTARSRPLFLPLVAQGAADGSLAIDDPETTTDLVLAVWLDGSTRLYDRALTLPDADAFVTTLTRGIAGLTVAVERILGAAPGSLSVPVEPATVRAMRAPFLAALSGGPQQRSPR